MTSRKPLNIFAATDLAPRPRTRQETSDADSAVFQFSLISLIVLMLALLAAPQRVTAAEMIVNGSFETGNFSGWTVVNPVSPWYAWQVVSAGFTNGFLSPAQPQHGTRSAFQGVTGGANSTYTIHQQFTLPAASTASVQWRHRFQFDNLTFCSGSGCGVVTYAVEVTNTSNTVLETLHVETVGPSTVRDTGWRIFSRSLTAYAGQTIRLRFRTNSTANLSGPGQLELDAISVQTPSILAPTSAAVTVAGRVTGPDGKSIGNANVTLSDQDGATRVARTNPFGYFRFDAVMSGRTYLVSASARGWSFTPRAVTVVDELADLILAADDPLVLDSEPGTGKDSLTDQ